MAFARAEKVVLLSFGGARARLYSSVCDGLRAQYELVKTATTHRSRLPPAIDLQAVFANNELNLRDISVYGFDYDYTLAVYTKDLNTLIYQLALQQMIERFKYPSIVVDVNYDPQFAVRGLHYDKEKGVLMKLDAFCQIQLGTVYRGKQEVSDDEVRRWYGGTSIPRYQLAPEHLGAEPRMKQLIDLFSLPELGLLAHITECFIENNIPFDSQSLFQDVTEAVATVHLSGQLHQAVMDNTDRYIRKSSGIRSFLERLLGAGKLLFLITNSPYYFVNHGMSYLIGSDWRKLFNVVVVKARKPRFFHEQSKRPFRIYNEDTDRLSYEKVNELRSGYVYAEGSLRGFAEKAKLDSKGVLYFGDHMFADLAEPMLKYGWRTGAIVPELKSEINTMNTDEYRKTVMWLQALLSLIDSQQHVALGHADAEALLGKWLEERATLRSQAKCLFNPNFGSIFRTHHNPTYFSRRLMRLADVYTSALPNLLNYPLNYTFYPRRAALPHENLF